MRHPRTVMTFSDSGAHLSQIADSSIHTHLLGHWVRDRQEFTLEEAVRMITLAPALAWGFADRGLRARGHASPTSTCSIPPPSAPPVPTLVDDLPAGGCASSSARSGSSPRSSSGQVTIEQANAPRATPGELIRARVA